MSRVINKTPFQIEIEEYEVAEWFLKRVPSDFWRLSPGVVTNNADLRNPTLLLRITLDRTPRIRILNASDMKTEATPIETTPEFREKLLTELKTKEKQIHDANHGNKPDQNCGICAVNREGESA